MKAIERLYIYLESQEIKPTVFEREIGLSSGYLSKMKGREANMGEDIMNIVLDNCHLLSAEWLLNGKGNMLRQDKIYEEPVAPLDIVTESISKSPPGECLFCKAKDEIIAIQKEQIAMQKEFIECLREGSQIDEQKRKLL